MIELTIAIPTYNRNAMVLERLRELLPQLTARAALMVIDNCSTTPVAETIEALLAEHPSVNCSVVRNAVNIGGNANILRCFELCETEWLWVLGDDDRVHENAVATMLATIGADPDLTYVSFGPGAVGDDRPHSFLTTGQEEFAAKLDRFMHCNFISACLYNAAKLRPRIGMGYQYAYSCAPHTLMVLASLGTTGKCRFSDKKVVWWEPASAEQQTPNSMVWLGFPILLEIPLSARARADLARAMLRERPPLRTLTRELYYSAAQRNDFPTSRYQYDQLVARILYFDRGPLKRLRIAAYRLTLLFPRAFAFLNTKTAAITRRRLRTFVQSTRVD